jgi:hypothetical protein
MYGFRLTFAVFMDGDLPNSFSAASFIGEQTIILLWRPQKYSTSIVERPWFAGPHRIIDKRNLDKKKLQPLTGQKKMSEAYQLNKMYTF